MKNTLIEPTNFVERDDQVIQIAGLVAGLVGNKKNGVFVQSLPAPNAAMSTAPWLSQVLGWGGIIVEPEPRNYFELRKQNAHRSNVQIVHACLSTSDFPKEVSEILIFLFSHFKFRKLTLLKTKYTCKINPLNLPLSKPNSPFRKWNWPFSKPNSPYCKLTVQIHQTKFILLRINCTLLKMIFNLRKPNLAIKYTH